MRPKCVHAGSRHPVEWHWSLKIEITICTRRSCYCCHSNSIVLFISYLVGFVAFAKQFCALCLVRDNSSACFLVTVDEQFPSEHLKLHEFSTAASPPTSSRSIIQFLVPGPRQHYYDRCFSQIQSASDTRGKSTSEVYRVAVYLASGLAREGCEYGLCIKAAF